MNEIELARENERLIAAMKVLKFKMKIYKKRMNGNVILDEEDINEVLEIAGMKDKDVDVIKFDNCEEVAYEP